MLLPAADKALSVANTSAPPGAAKGAAAYIVGALYGEGGVVAPVGDGGAPYEPYVAAPAERTQSLQ